jgi:bromodomain adjacent to zinc finger domain protein 1A
MRGGYTSRDDPGLQLRIEEPQILKTLSQGTVFDLTLTERIKVIQCLINQVLTYITTRDLLEESFEQFKQTRLSLRALQAAEKRSENEDHLWR